MPLYARVEEGRVVELFDALPPNWRHVSNFYLLASDLPALAGLGWHVVTMQPYDPETHAVQGTRYDFVDGTVEQRLTLIAKSNKVEPADPDMMRVRQERDDLLRISDWTQSLDLYQRYPEWVERWSQYRQQLRDFPFRYEQSGRIETLPDAPNPAPRRGADKATGRSF